jgi:hypothetical protein
MKKEISGYKLLKDLPNLEKGSVFILEDGDYVNSDYVYTPSEIMNLTNWFEPIYQEEYKVGDWVTKLSYFSSNGSMGNSNYGGAGFDKLPSTFLIERVESTSSFVKTQGSQVLWSDNHGVYSKSVRHANKDEIKDALLKEAKKRYPIGTKFKCLHDCNRGPIKEEDYNIQTYDDIYCIRVLNGSGCIYDSGKWAEIIENKLELPRIYGYNGVETSNTIHYGCSVFYKEFLLEMKNNGIRSFNIQIGGTKYPVKEEQFNQIINYIENT